MTPNTSTLAAALLKASTFAARKHRDQRRKDAEASPYINHPLEVAEVLARIGGVYDATAAGTSTSFARMASATGKWRASKAKGVSAPAFFDDSPQQAAGDAPAGKLTPKGAGAATSGDSTRSHRPGKVEPRTGRLNVKRATGSGN